jgi:hypothetical protein
MAIAYFMALGFTDIVALKPTAKTLANSVNHLLDFTTFTEGIAS